MRLARMEYQRLFLLAVLCGTCFWLYFRTPNMTHRRKYEGMSFLTRYVKQKLANLTTNECYLRNRTLALGDKASWGHQRRRDGAFTFCMHCQCTVTSETEDVHVQCGIFGCPFHMCIHNNPAYNPKHACCSVCETPPPKNDTPAVQLAVDDSVPLTRDIYTSSFRHAPVSICPDDGGTTPMALLAVTSRPRAAERRAIFRRMYGAEGAERGLRLLFVLGRDAVIDKAFNDFRRVDDEYEYESEIGEEAAKTSLRLAGENESASFDAWQHAVDREAAEFGDILQSDITEHYNHLALKTLSLLDFVQAHCGHVRFVVKTDDDVLVTVRRLAENVAALAHVGGIHGQLCSGCSPISPLDSWNSDVREWPWGKYPPFVLGPGYLVAGAAAARLYSTALRTRYHHLEDVFITGIVAEAAGVARRQWDQQCSNNVDGGGLCELSHCALTHSDAYADGGKNMDLFVYATRRFDVDALCASNITIPSYPSQQSASDISQAWMRGIPENVT